MMTEKAIAQILLGRRNSDFTSIVDQASLNLLGEDGKADALALGWLRPQEGILVVCLDPGIYGQIKEAAVAEAKVPVPVAERRGIREAMAGHLGRSLESAPVLLPAAPSGPVSYTVAETAGFRPFRESNQRKVGDATVVADGGKSYKAVVQKVNPDGSYVLSFDNASKPLTVKPFYKDDELADDETKPKGPANGPQPPAPTKPPLATGALINQQLRPQA